MNQTIKKISVTILATLACGAVMAGELHKAPGRQSIVPLRAPDAADVIFGTNLEVDPCTGCNYDSINGGYYVWGTNNCISPGTTQWIAVRFIAKATGTPRRISASINLDPACPTSTNQVTLGIYTDVCGTGPGAVLASGRAIVPAAPCALAVASLRTTATLTAGTPYWVVATTNATQDGLDAIWYGSNQALIGGNVANGGWFQFSGFTPGFMVN
jgi:hypothetical protein